MKISKTQLAVLKLAADFAPCGWGEIWSQYDAGPQPGHSAFRMMNFDRAAEALKQRGLLTSEDGDVDLTDAGRAALR